MDHEIKSHVRECAPCQNMRKMPPVAPIHPWSQPERLKERVNVNYAGLLEAKLFLLIIDAYSKWVEVHITNSTASSTTMELLYKLFVFLGLPDVRVSDNGTSFTSGEFAEFMRRNGIHHIHSPLYHPSSNSLAKRVVQDSEGGAEEM